MRASVRTAMLLSFLVLTMFTAIGARAADWDPITDAEKALKSDPLGTAPLRTFRCAVFSSGEPPVIKEEDLSGAQVRVIEFDSGPWGGELPREQFETWVEKISKNYGHAADVFIEHFIKTQNEYDWNTTHPGDDKLTPVENRVKKIINLIWVCGTVVNELFDFDFDVDKDCIRIFEIIKKQLELKQKTSERIMDHVHDFYLENQANFIETTTDPLTHKITAKVPNSGKVHGYIFGQDLAIIKSVFKDAMNLRLHQPNGGGYAINRLIKSKDIAGHRTMKQVNGRQESYVYFFEFFGHQELF